MNCWIFLSKTNCTGQKSQYCSENTVRYTSKLLESNGDMTFYISGLSVGLKGDIRITFKKIRKMFMWKWDIRHGFILGLVLLAIEETNNLLTIF